MATRPTPTRPTETTAGATISHTAANAAAATAALQAAWRKKYAGKGGSDVAPPVGSTAAQNQDAQPRRQPSTSAQALNPDPHQNETETEAERIRRINRQRRQELHGSGAP